MKRKSYLILFVLLFLLVNLKGIAMVTTQPEVGDKISGSFIIETEYIDPRGEEHTGKYSTMISMEIVDIFEKTRAKAPEKVDKVAGLYTYTTTYPTATTNTYETETSEWTTGEYMLQGTYYRVYVTVETDKIVSAYLEEGRWTYQEIMVNMESTGYYTFGEPYEDYSPDTIDILNEDSLVGDSYGYEWYIGTIRHPFPSLYISYYDFYELGFGFHDPGDYLEEYKDEANDIFDDFEEVDWSYDYTDGVTGERKTLDGTAELESSSVDLDDLTLKIDYTITSARDRYTFDRGPHNKPNKIDYEFSLTLTYSENGFLKSFNSIEVYDAGDNGKVTYKYSFDGDSDGNGGGITSFGFGWVTIFLIIGIVTIFRRIKTMKRNL